MPPPRTAETSAKPDDLAQVADAARRAHDEHHFPNWAYYEDAICAAVPLAS